MNHADRVPTYQQIEKDRGTKVLALVTGERLGLQTQIARDAVDPFVSLLDRIGPTKKISLILDTMGGQTAAAWRLINLIRSFCDELEAVIPTKAMSAGTLMSLGADQIVMTKQAALGPIDPSLDNHPLSPEILTATGSKVRVPVSAEAIRGFLDEVRKDIKDQASLVAIWNQLATQVHPIVLGEIFRLGGQIRSMATDLIRNQVKDAGKQAEIIQLLCSDSGSHDYTINRRKATEIGLNVDKPSAALYGLLGAITKSYTGELKTLEPYSSQVMLGANKTVNYKLIRGLIESVDESYGFVSEGTFSANPSGGSPLDQRTFEGWRKLP
jgi:Serine dehydrogenase proteinase